MAQDPGGQPCTESPEVCGKRAFQEGIEAYRVGDYPRALRAFRQAQATKPHPSILFNVALAEAKTGLFVEALAHLQAVFSDPQTPADLLPPVREERDQVAARIATVSVVNENAELFVDESPGEGRPPERRVNPGQHRVRVVLRGKTVVDRTVELVPGEHVQLALAESTPEPALVPPVPRRTPRTAPPLPATKPAERRGVSPWWVVAGAGVTAALGSAALVSYLDTSRAFSDFKRDLPNLTETQAKRRVDEGQGKQTRTQWLLGSTLVAGVATAGLALFWTDWPTRTKAYDPGRMSLGVALSAVSLRGRF